MQHPERIAAGIADLNNLVLRYELPIKVKRPRPSLGDVLGVLVIFGLGFAVWVAT